MVYKTSTPNPLSPKERGRERNPHQDFYDFNMRLDICP
jgi:hypothetical protein